MSLKSLFDLDSDKFDLGKNSGTFRRVREKTQQLSLSELMKGISAPVLPSNIPTVTPLSEADKARVDSFSGLAATLAQQATAARPYGQWLGDADSIRRGSAYLEGVAAGWYKVGARKEAADARTYKSYADQYAAEKAYLESMTSGYNNQVKAYNAVVDPYKTEVDKYNQERQVRAGNYNTVAINPELVTKQTQESTGDVLAESDLYSDDLHNMMIERISTQPILDKVAAMFSPQSGGSK